MDSLDQVLKTLTETPDPWGVFVNEASIIATGQGVEWWANFTSRFETTNRMTCLKPSVGGSMWHVKCDSQQDAEWLAWEMTEVNGIPKRAVKVKTLAQCAHLRTGA